MLQNMKIDELKLFYYRHQAENIHAIKAGIAFFLGYLATNYMPLGKSPWILITIAVIMSSQAVLGIQVNRSILRLLGTLAGAVFGMIALYIIGHDWLLLAYLLIISVIFTKLAIHYNKFNYGITLGLVTFILIAFGNQTNFDYVIGRVLDISCGIVICLGVSAFIFPFDARRSFMITMINNFKNITQFVELIFIQGKERRQDPEVIKLELKIMTQLSTQRDLIKAVHYEKIKHSHIKKNLMHLYRSQRAVYHYLIFIEVALYEGQQEKDDHRNDYVNCLQPLLKELTLFFSTFNIQKNTALTPQLIEEFKMTNQRLMNLSINSSNLNEQQRKDVILFALRRTEFVLINLIKFWNDKTSSAEKTKH